MDERLNDRLRRATAEATAQGYAAMIVAPSPDLAYLTGYEPMPMERPTLLVLREDRDPVMLVPELERPLAAASSAGAVVELVGWTDGDDPYTAAAHLLEPQGRVAVGDRLWASHVLGLQGVLPDLTFEPASPVIGRLRAVKDDDELAALRRAARGADETFRQICSSTFLGRREEEIALQHAFCVVASDPARNRRGRHARRSSGSHDIHSNVAGTSQLPARLLSASAATLWSASGAGAQSTGRSTR